MTLNQNLLENPSHSKPAFYHTTLKKDDCPRPPTITLKWEDNESTFVILSQLRHQTPLTHLKVFTPKGSPFTKQKQTIWTTNQWNSWKLSRMKDLFLLLDSATLKGKGPPPPSTTCRNFPSTLTEAYITKRRRKTSRKRNKTYGRPRKRWSKGN